MHVQDLLTKRVRESVHFCARPTIEKGSQCVGMNECKSDTVAIPPIVDRSSALKPSITAVYSSSSSCLSIPGTDVSIRLKKLRVKFRASQ